MTLSELIEKFKSYVDCKEYISASGKKCYCTYGSFAWYDLMCSKMGITPGCVNSYVYEAKGDGFTLEYVEHDIILALDGKEEKE